MALVERHSFGGQLKVFGTSVTIYVLDPVSGNILAGHDFFLHQLRQLFRTFSDAISKMEYR
jgi:hypothetical protein